MVFPFDKYLWFMVIYFFLNLAFVLTGSVYFFPRVNPYHMCPYQIESARDKQVRNFASVNRRIFYKEVACTMEKVPATI